MYENHYKHLSSDCMQSQTAEGHLQFSGVGSERLLCHLFIPRSCELARVPCVWVWWSLYYRDFGRPLRFIELDCSVYVQRKL